MYPTLQSFRFDIMGHCSFSCHFLADNTEFPVYNLTVNYKTFEIQTTFTNINTSSQAFHGSNMAAPVRKNVLCELAVIYMK